MSLLLGLGTAAAGIVGGLIGSNKAKKEAAAAREANDRMLAQSLDRYNNNLGDMTQRADIQALAENVRESILQRNKQAANPIAQNTVEGMQAERAQNAEDARQLAQTAVAAGTNQKMQNEQALQQAQMQHGQNEMAIRQGQAQAVSQATGNMVQSLVQGGLQMAEQSTRKPRKLFDGMFGDSGN